MLKVTIRGLLAHKVRFIATALAVLLGVAFMAGTQVFTDTFSKSFDQIFVDVDKGTDAVVRSNVVVKSDFGDQRSRISETVLPQVRKVDGVAAADGVIRGNLRILDKTGKPMGNANAGPPTLGLNWIDAAQLNQWNMVEGRPPTADDEVVLDRKSATDGNYDVGDMVKLVVGQGDTRAFRLVGVAKFGTLDNFSGAAAALLDTPHGAAARGRAGQVRLHRRSGGDPASRNMSSSPTSTPPGCPSDTQVDHRRRVHQGEPGHLRARRSARSRRCSWPSRSCPCSSARSSSTTPSRSSWPSGHVRSRCCGPSAPARRQVLGSIFLEAVAVGLVASLLGLLAGIGLAVGLRSLLDSGRHRRARRPRR